MLESALEQIKTQMDKSVEPSPWDRLKTATGNMDASQIKWVLGRKEVADAYEKMISAFNTWMFENNKDSFGRLPAYRPLVDEYINAVIQSAQEYGQRAQNLEAENAVLRKQLEELMNNAK